jgi:hypothetical protein
LRKPLIASSSALRRIASELVKARINELPEGRNVPIQDRIGHAICTIPVNAPLKEQGDGHEKAEPKGSA